tara:strand:- start:40 stop:579 length:540 start_codon:yes stop_codon:yes gene_type:complete
MISKSSLIMIFTLFMSISSPAKSDFFDLVFESIDGKIISLKEFKNKPIVIVNSASFCGFTYQYEQLENLYQKFKKKGLVVMAIPSNDFGGQEFKDNKKVKEFCEVNFNISFPITSITKVKGKNKHPFFKWVEKEAGYLSLPKWNFYKYLINKNGKLSAWFSSVTKPSSEKFLNEIKNII